MRWRVINNKKAQPAFYTDVLHAGMLVTGGHIGEIPDYLVLKVQELMAKEVMPHFREKAAAGQSA